LPRLKRQGYDKAGSDDLHKSKIKNLGPTAMKNETRCRHRASRLGKELSAGF